MDQPVLRIAVLDLPPLYAYTMNANRTVPLEFGKLILDYMEKIMNIRSETIYSGFGFGSSSGRNNYTGALGMIIRQEADVMLALYPAVPELFDHIGFSTAVEAMDCAVLSGPPNKVSEQASSLLSSIGLIPLVTLAVTWVAVSIVYYLLHVEDRLLDENPVSNRFDDILINFYGLMFQRGFRSEVPHTGRRLVVCGWLIMALVLMTVLAGTLYSKLAVVAVPERIDSLEDVLKYPNVIPYVTKGVVVDNYLQLSENKEQMELWSRVNQRNGLREMEHFFNDQPLEEVAEGKAVIISNKEAFLVSVVGHACTVRRRQYHLSKNDFLSTSLHIFYRKGLAQDMVQKLDYVSAFFGGLHQVYRVRNFPLFRSQPCLHHSSTNVESPLGIKELRQGFLLLLYAWTASTIAFCFEMLWTKQKWFKARARSDQILKLDIELE